MCYLVGEELRQRGDLEVAKTCFRRALIGPLMQSHFSTLAGDRLCQMNESGKSRPDKYKLVPTRCGLRLTQWHRLLKVQLHEL